MKSILTVCIGNICRSPMAEALLANALPDLTVSSAGTDALHGMPPDESAQRLMLLKGLDIGSHRARQITRDMCQRADLVLVMDTKQRRWLENVYPEVCGKVYRLGEHAKRDIADPYRRGDAAFKGSLALIEYGVQEWLHRINKLRTSK